MTNETLPELTAGEIAALQAYAAKHGRKWKASLLDDWMRAALTGELQALRNSHGPSWLTRYKLPAGERLEIAVRYSSIDNYSETRKFKTIDGARAYACKWIGPHPTLGTYYAVSDDGVGKITAAGIALSDLFPASQNA